MNPTLSRWALTAAVLGLLASPVLAAGPPGNPGGSADKGMPSGLGVSQSPKGKSQSGGAQGSLNQNKAGAQAAGKGTSQSKTGNAAKERTHRVGR